MYPDRYLLKPEMMLSRQTAGHIHHHPAEEGFSLSGNDAARR